MIHNKSERQPESPTAATSAGHSSDPRRRALGRGLESLLPTKANTPAPAAPPTVSDGKPLEIPLERVARNPFQTRTQFDPEQLKDLAQSIAATGVVQPILVRPLVHQDGQPSYQLIAGERRVLASRQAGKTTIPAIVRIVSDEQAMEMTIVENLQRADLNPMEQARAYQRLSIDFKMTQEQMATRTGKERTTITNFLRLLRLPELVQLLVESGDLTFGHARALLALPTPDLVLLAARKVIALALSVRQTETYVQGLMNPEAKAAKADKPQVKEPLDPNVVEAQMLMQRSLGLRVRIEDKRGKGRVIIDYANLEDFDLLLSALSASSTN